MNKVNSVLNWFIYVVIFSILPFAINFFIYFSASKKLYDNTSAFTGDLFFFTLMIGADNLKNVSISKMASKSKLLHTICFGISILTVIFASLLYGIVIVNNITDKINIDEIFNSSRFKQIAIFSSVGCLIIGLTIQIWMLIDEGDETDA